jgi:outer membrane protein with beta-barrel domain
MNRRWRSRRLVAALLLGLLAPPLAAQGRSSIGVELGYTRASFSGRNSRGVKLHEGAIAGGYFQVRLTPWLAIRPGVQFASKGGATTALASDSSGFLRLDLDLVYLDFPVLLRSRVPLVGRTRLILTGGGVPTFRIGCNVDLSRGGTPVARSECGQTNASFRSWDLEWLVGAGLGIPIENSELALEARFTQGTRSLSDQGDLKNRALTFIISVPF